MEGQRRKVATGQRDERETRLRASAAIDRALSNNPIAEATAARAIAELPRLEEKLERTASQRRVLVSVR